VVWHSVHVYYYESDKDALILQGVRPLFRHLAGQVDAVSFTRHWRLGPHLRLNMDTDADTFAEVVLPAVDEIVGGFLACYPSTRRLDPERELAAHRRLAEKELEKGPLLPWQPDNSIQVAPYDRRTEALGSEELADLLADFHADTTELAFRMIEEVSGPERRAASFDLMIASAHMLSGAGISSAFISFRSHAEGFLWESPDRDRLRAAWNEHFARNAAASANRVRTLVAALDDGRPVSPFVHDWIAVATPFRDRATRLAADDGIRLESATAGEGTERVRTDISPFHQKLLANPGWSVLRESPPFLVYRVMLNLTYLMLTRIGIAPAERFLLGHLAANAVEECYGVSAFELIGEVM
jgi:hypothetical protein